MAKYRKFRSEKEWFEYGRRRGYHRLSRTELAKEYPSYYNIGRGQGWLPILIPMTKRRDWKSKKEWLIYGREKGYHELSRGTLQKTDAGYYATGQRRKWISELIPETIIRLPWKSKEEWLEYGRKQGYHQLSRSELQKRDSGYSDTGKRRRWLDDLIPKPLKTVEDVEKYIAQEPAAKKIVQIASLNRSYGDIAQIFAELWPDRFPSTEALSKQLPSVIPKISPAIAPIALFQRAFVDLYELLPSENIPRNLQDLIYRIGIDVYQAEFNRDPKGTLDRLQALAKTLENKQARRTIHRIYSLYRETYQFHIPGVGRLSERYLQR